MTTENDNQQHLERKQKGCHSGCEYTVTIRKTPVGTYTATAEIQLPGYSETIEYPNGAVIEIGPKVRKPESGGYFDSNPFQAITEHLHGFIDGRLDLALEATAGSNGEAWERFKQVKTAAKAMQPRTAPTPAQLAAMADGIAGLVDHFTVPGLAHLCGQSTQTVRNWVSRGRIGAQMAHELCKKKEVSALGYTREKLRPDVVSWVQVDVEAGSDV